MMALQFFDLTLVFSVQVKCPPISRMGEQLENVEIITFLQELMLGPFGGFCKKDYFFFHQLQSAHMTKAGAQIAATIQSKNQTFHNTACKTMCNNKTLSTSWIPFIFCLWVHRQRTSLSRYGVLIRLHHVQCLNTCIRRTRSGALPQAAATIWAELHYVSPCLFILLHFELLFDPWGKSIFQELNYNRGS